MKGTRLDKRVRQLALLERINIVLLPISCWIWATNMGHTLGWASLVGMTLNGFLLYQGANFWQAVGNWPVPLNILNRFALLRKLNYLLIPVSLLLILFLPTRGNFDFYTALGFWTLALLEQINYYEIQLMYDNARDLSYLKRYGLKKAWLRELMERSGLR